MSNDKVDDRRLYDLLRIASANVKKLQEDRGNKNVPKEEWRKRLEDIENEMMEIRKLTDKKET